MKNAGVFIIAGNVFKYILNSRKNMLWKFQKCANISKYFDPMSQALMNIRRVVCNRAFDFEAIAELKVS